MASGWVSAKFEDLKDEAPVTNRAHSFRGIHGTHGFPQFCRFCGHVPLKNAISELVTRLGCGYESNSQFREWLRTRRFR